MRMRKVVITGGAGYIGWHLCRFLMAQGMSVTVLDDLLFGDEAVRDLSKSTGITFLKGNVLNISDVARALDGAYAVIHLAAVVGDPACCKNPDYTRMVNIESTKTIIDIANHYKVQRLLFASSCSVYGAAPADVLLNEGSYLNPISLYAETRIASEEIIFADCKVPVPTVLRLATAYGCSKRMRFDLAVNLMTAKAATEGLVRVFGGEQFRPFVHCEDIARAFVSALFAREDLVGREIFNVGSNDQNYCLAEVGSLISETLGSRMALLPEMEDERSYRVDFSKVEWLLNFQPKRRVRESVLEINNGFKSGEFPDWKEDKYYNVRYEYML